MSRSTKDRLRDIEKNMQKILDYTEGMSFHEFMKDEQTIDAVENCYKNTGEAAKKIPDNITEKYDSIEWSSIAGMRDFMTHKYWESDPEVAYDSSREDIEEDIKIIRKILEEEF